MVTTVINLKDLPNELKEYSSLALHEQRKAVVKGLYRSLPGLVAESPIDTGLYAQSWDVIATEDKAGIGNYAPHAAIIENGARPFTPPLSPLLAWAKRVLKDPSQPPSYSPEVQRLARGVQKKISEQGMKPKYILQNYLQTIFENIKKEMDGVKV